MDHFKPPYIINISIWTSSLNFHMGKSTEMNPAKQKDCGFSQSFLRKKKSIKQKLFKLRLFLNHHNYKGLYLSSHTKVSFWVDQWVRYLSPNWRTSLLSPTSSTPVIVHYSTWLHKNLFSSAISNLLHVSHRMYYSYYNDTYTQVSCISLTFSANFASWTLLFNLSVGSL